VLSRGEVPVAEDDGPFAVERNVALTIPIADRDDWHTAARILSEEVARISASEEAATAVAAMIHRYPVPRTEVESRVFASATDNYLELSGRFVVPVRSSRRAKDELTRRVSRSGGSVRSPSGSVAFQGGRLTDRRRNSTSVLLSSATRFVS